MIDLSIGNVEHTTILTQLESNENDTLDQIADFVNDVDIESTHQLNQTQQILLALLEYKANSENKKRIDDAIQSVINKIDEKLHSKLNIPVDFGATTILYLENSLQDDRKNLAEIKRKIGDRFDIKNPKNEKERKITEWIDQHERKIKNTEKYLEILKSNASLADNERVNLSQHNVLNKIRSYADWYNQNNPNRPFVIPYDSPAGWCNGLTSMWGNSKINNAQFFNILNTIVSTPFENLTDSQHHEIQEFITEVSLAQARIDVRTQNHLDANQWELKKQFSLEPVDRLQLICANESELKLVIEYYAKNHPNTFIRLDFHGHSTAFMYDAQSGMVRYYDPNQYSGNIAADVDSGKVFTSEQELSIEDFVKKIPSHALEESAHNLPIFIEVYKPTAEIAPGEIESNKEKRNELLQNIFQNRIEHNIESHYDPKSEMTLLTMAVERNDIDAVNFYIKQNVSCESSNNSLFFKAIRGNNLQMLQIVCEAFVKEKMREGFSENDAKLMLANRLTTEQNIVEGKRPLSPLTHAILGNKVEIVDWMTNQLGVDISKPCYDNLTPIELACLYNKTEIITTLSDKLPTLDEPIRNQLEERLITLLAVGLHKRNQTDLDDGLQFAVENISMDIPDKVRERAKSMRDQTFAKEAIERMISSCQSQIDPNKPKKDQSQRHLYLQMGILSLCKNPSDVDMRQLLELTKSDERRILFGRIQQKLLNQADLRGSTDVLDSIEELKKFILKHPPTNEENRTLIRGFALSLQEEKGYSHQTKVGTLLTEFSNQIENISKECQSRPKSNEECKREYRENFRKPPEPKRNTQPRH